MKIPSSIVNLIDNFERLPGIGPKTAQRLVFQLLHFPQNELERFANNLIGLKNKTKLCSICKNVSEGELCSVCNDEKRDRKKIIVVASSLDSFAIEKSGYKGTYHILHGLIDPLNNIGPDEIFIKDLISRLETIYEENVFESTEDSVFDSTVENTSPIVEVILGTNSSMEGESTAMYITKLIKDRLSDKNIRITRIARGLPVGGDIEYADDITLSRALEGRRDI